MSRLATLSGNEIFPVLIGTFGIASWENPETADILRYTGYKNVGPVYGNEAIEIAGLQYSLQHDEDSQNYIDTAGLYGGGYTNEVIGQALVAAQVPRPDLFIAHNVWKSHYDDVYAMVKLHLGKLGTDYFDVAGPHSPHTQGWDVPVWQSTMEDFARLKDEGLIRGVSVSNFSIDQIEEAERLLGFPVTTAQAGYSVHDQSEKKRDLRDYCSEKGIQLIGYQALSGGVLKNNAVQEVAAAHEVSPAQVGLAFVMHEGILPIAKAIDPAHIDDNIAAASLVLEQAEVEVLRDQTTGSKR